MLDAARLEMGAGRRVKRAKWIVPIAALAAVMVSSAPQPAQALGWLCIARSPTGSWGWSRQILRSRARRLALRNCEKNTPSEFICRIDRCARD